MKNVSKGVECRVYVDGQPATEYGFRSEGDHDECYIESIEGKEFYVRWTQDGKQSGHKYVTGNLYIDGQFKDGQVSKTDLAGISESNAYGGMVMKGVYDQANSSVRNFVFATLQKSEDEDTACTAERIVKNVGRINLKLLRSSTALITDEGDSPLPNIYNPTFRETIKHLDIDHQVAHTAPVTLAHKERSFLVYDYTDTEDTPWLQFTFKYRKRRFLEEKGFVQATPGLGAVPHNGIEAEQEEEADLEYRDEPAAAVRANSAAPISNARRPTPVRGPKAGPSRTASGQSYADLQAENERLRQQLAQAQSRAGTSDVKPDIKPDTKPDIKPDIKACPPKRPASSSSHANKRPKREH